MVRSDYDSEIKSQAGTTVAERNDQLYAFDEFDLPYEMDPDTLQTLGQSRPGLPEGFSIYAVHWKIEPHNQEWLHFGVKFGPTLLLHIGQHFEKLNRGSRISGRGAIRYFGEMRASMPCMIPHQDL